MRLEDKDQQVLASQIVRDIIKIADELLSDYNLRSGAVMITLDDAHALLNANHFVPGCSKAHADHSVHFFHR